MADKKHWIAGAVKNKGALHQALDSDNELERKLAQLARTLSRFPTGEPAEIFYCLMEARSTSKDPERVP